MDLQNFLSFELCRPSTVVHVEEMSLESPKKRQEVEEAPRKMQDEQEATSETAGKATRRTGEGKTEMPETRVVSDGVEGINVDLNGECHHERWRVKNSRRQSDAPGEEGEEILSAKRNVIWVESEETQDCVRKAKGTDQEEAEEMSFVPNAISVPRKAMFRSKTL